MMETKIIISFNKTRQFTVFDTPKEAIQYCKEQYGADIDITDVVTKEVAD